MTPSLSASLPLSSFHSSSLFASFSSSFSASAPAALSSSLPSSALPSSPLYPSVPSSLPFPIPSSSPQPMPSSSLPPLSSPLLYFLLCLHFLPKFLFCNCLYHSVIFLLSLYLYLSSSLSLPRSLPASFLSPFSHSFSISLPPTIPLPHSPLKLTSFRLSVSSHSTRSLHISHSSPPFSHPASQTLSSYSISAFLQALLKNA